MSALKKKTSPQWGLAFRIFVCIFAVGWTLYAFIDKQNELVELRLAIPQLSKEVKALQEENIRLKYEVDSFESPIHLLELTRKPEFTHLKYPYINTIIQIPFQTPLQDVGEK